MGLSRRSVCMHCEKDFESKNLRRLFCSDKCKVRYNRENRLLCFYCGDLATQRDHVYPHSAQISKHRRYQGQDIVNACEECNRLAYNAYPTNLVKRIEHVRDKFKAKYKLHRAFIEWDEDDLSEVSGSMSKWIAAKQRQRIKSEQRLSHMSLRAIEVAVIRDSGDPDECDDFNDDDEIRPIIRPDKRRGKKEPRNDQ